MLTAQEEMAQELAAQAGCPLSVAREMVVMMHAAALWTLSDQRADAKAYLAEYGIGLRWRNGDLV